MDDALAFLVLGTLASKLTDVLKFLRNKDWNGAITQGVTWAIGVILMFLASAANVMHDVVVPSIGVTFGSLDAGSKVLIGASITSLLSVAYDFRKAIDGSDSARMPPLLPEAPPPPE